MTLSAVAISSWANDTNSTLKVVPQQINSTVQEQGIIYDSNHRPVGKVLGYSSNQGSTNQKTSSLNNCGLKCRKPPYQGGPVHVPVEPTSGILK